jgi:hypothetical protein
MPENTINFPSDLTVTAKGTLVNLSWTRVEHGIQCLFFRKAGTQNWKTVFLSDTANSYTLIGLEVATYEFILLVGNPKSVSVQLQNQY